MRAVSAQISFYKTFYETRFLSITVFASLVSLIPLLAVWPMHPFPYLPQLPTCMIYQHLISQYLVLSLLPKVHLSRPLKFSPDGQIQPWLRFSVIWYTTKHSCCSFKQQSILPQFTHCPQDYFCDFSFSWRFITCLSQGLGLYHHS